MLPQEKLEEITVIKGRIFRALPTNVDKASIIIALAEVQARIAELIIDDDPQLKKDT